jgi:hypothetical protein
MSGGRRDAGIPRDRPPVSEPPNAYDDATEEGFQIPNSGFQIPNSRSQIPESSSLGTWNSESGIR